MIGEKRMSSEQEKKRLDQIAGYYEQAPFWENYVKKCGDIIAPKICGKSVLEMGCSTLVLSKMLSATAGQFDIVEGSEVFAELARDFFGDQVSIYHSLFEEFTPQKEYDAVVLANTLHHLSDPEAILVRMKDWLALDGTVYITVPNMKSIHRQLGVKIGLLADLNSTSDRNDLFKQSGRYTKESLIAMCEACGYCVTESYGFFLKPFSDEMMASLNPSQALIDALFELGREYEDGASLIYAELAVKHEKK